MTSMLSAGEMAELRASERERMAPMRESARKEAFVQGWLRGSLGDPSEHSDEALLAALPYADEAYAEFAKTRGPA